MKYQPLYLNLFKTGELDNRVKLAEQHLAFCVFCGRSCKVDRLKGEYGACGIGVNARISSYGPHHGEETPLSGKYGSGTIFFSGCNLRCQYCQNFTISQSNAGYEAEPGHLASIMLELQERGCHNINFVSPSHVVAPILSAVSMAVRRGLRLPLVFNSGGFDSMTALSLLDGVIDIYMPDMKYSDNEAGFLYSGIKNYMQVNQEAVREMHRQVGDLCIDESGIAARGLLVRHLVLPNGISGAFDVIHFLASEISKNTYLNLMDQYHPAYHAFRFPELNRSITQKEYLCAVNFARQCGLNNLDSRNIT